MRLFFAATLITLPLLTLTSQSLAQMTPEASAALQKPIMTERDVSVATVPLTLHMGKLALDAAVHGIKRQFIFDTGSPTMISRELAQELDLKIIGSNTGRDANGKEFTTDIAIVDRLTIGPVTFRKVPVLIADFSLADPDGCFFDGGVIGSEIFPSNVWHIDLERQSLNIAAKFDDLANEAIADKLVAENTISAPLLDVGYPHAPVFDYAIGTFKDKGLFDTGNSDVITLFDGVAQDAQVQKAMISSSVRKGRGSHGVSAGGRGADADLLRFEIEGMLLGQQELGRRPGTTRNAAPSLIGMGILATHSVTLDYPNARMLLHPRSQPEPTLPHPGYALMSNQGEVRVMQIFDNSAAQRAGLTLGDRVVAIDGRTLLSSDTSCETAQWLIDMRATQSARNLTILRQGQRLEVTLERQ